MFGKIHELEVTEVADFADLASKEDDLNELFEMLKVSGRANELALTRKVAIRLSLFNPTVKPSMYGMSANKPWPGCAHGNKEGEVGLC